MEEAVVGEGHLTRISVPKAISLVGRPANKVAWRVVRSADATTKGENEMKPPIVRRARRSEPSPILRMSFPLEYTDEQVTAKMGEFGLTGYDVLRNDTAVLATRGDLKSISAPLQTTAIRLTADGIVAEVARGEPAPTNPKSQISIASLTFRSDKFTPEKVGSWLADNKIETAAPVAAEGEGDFIVTRHEVPEGEETRVVELEEGVTATVMRSDCCDIPEGFIAVVNETCYGNWGWGQLDFNASMADKQFSDLMEDAIWRLRDVLKHILLYSSLPLDERKTLAARALEQFGTFTASILDSLPRTVLVAVVRSASPTKEKLEMTTKTASGANPNTADTDDNKPVTRSELKALIAEAMAANAQRSEPAPTPAAPTTEASKQEGSQTTEPAAPATAITRDDLVAAAAAAAKEAVAPLVERIAQVEGKTVVRSEGSDGALPVAGEKNKEGGKADVFRGAPAFAGLGLSRVRGDGK